jgi:hypothetical protein
VLEIGDTDFVTADATLWFGSVDSRGFAATHDAALARGLSYPFMIVYRGVTRPTDVAAWVEAKGVGV